MGNFNRDDRSAGGYRSGFSRGRGSFGGGRGGDRPMFKAICSNCGKECEVPFRPTNGKPVYCSDCFEKMRGGRSNSSRPERPDPRPQGGGHNNNQFEAINTKLDRIIKLLEPEKKAFEPKAPVPVISKPVVLTPSVEKVISETVVLKAPKVKPDSARASTGKEKKDVKKSSSAKKK